MARSASAIAAEKATDRRDRHDARPRPSRGASACSRPLRLRDHVLDHARDQPAHQFVHHADWASSSRMPLCESLSRISRDQRHVGEYRRARTARRAGRRRCRGRHRRCRRRWRRPAPRRWRSSRAPGPGFRDRSTCRTSGSHAAARARDSARSGVPSRSVERAVVLDQPFERLPGEIEAVEGGIAALERGHHPQRLRVVVEAAAGGKAAIERALAGMAERRMAEIVRQAPAPRRDPRRARARAPASGRSG